MLVLKFLSLIGNYREQVMSEKSELFARLVPNGDENGLCRIDRKKLLALPVDKQAEVFDFVEFLSCRNLADRTEEHSIVNTALAATMKNPLKVSGFVPLGREEANAR